uniref:Uncharacterized protein n=1 Tax=Glossina austeni TaxID=7395 RepID=A0A1A9VJ60_GLOAU
MCPAYNGNNNAENNKNRNKKNSNRSLPKRHPNETAVIAIYRCDVITAAVALVREWLFSIVGSRLAHLPKVEIYLTVVLNSASQNDFILSGHNPLSCPKLLQRIMFRC